MIIYGWNSKVIKQAPFPGFTCPGGEQEEAHIVVTASYFHIFWIPVFPYKKKLQIVCPGSGLTMKPKDVSEEVRQLAKQLKSTVKTPFWMFSGVGVVAILIMVGIVSSFLGNQKDLELLKDPQVNDIYYFYDKEESSEYKYFLRKVVDVQGDSVYIAPNSFQYNWKATYLMTEDGFYDIYYTVHKNDLIDLYEDDVIREIKRGFEEGKGFERELVFPDSLMEN